MKLIGNPIRIITGFFILCFLTACTQPNDNSGGETSVNKNAVQKISGQTSKGPLSGATLEFYNTDASWQPIGQPVATTITDAAGNWTLAELAVTQPLLVVSKGGSYVDESDLNTPRRRIHLGVNEQILGLLLPGQNRSAITPITHALILRLRFLALQGKNKQSSLDYVQQQSSTALGFNPFTQLPADPLAPANTSLVAARRYGILLGAIANAQNRMSVAMGYSVSNYQVLETVIKDMANGELDGLGLTGQLHVNGAPLPNNLRLANEAERFLNNNYYLYEGLNLGLPPSNRVHTHVSPVIAVNDNLTVNEDEVSLLNVLANDANAHLGALPITSHLGGSLTPVGDQVQYVPPANFTGIDSFIYSTATNEHGDSDTAVVTLTVSNVADAPIGVSDSYLVARNIKSVIGNVLDNDSDIEGQPLSIAGAPTVTQQGGELFSIGDGNFEYRPPASFTGNDQFEYSLQDSSGLTTNVLVTLSVDDDNDQDGIADSRETGEYHTSPNNPDTDGDTFSDLHEIRAGSDPLNAAEFPAKTVISAANSNNVITGHTIWGLANSPYHVQSNVNVQAGSVLSIEPGVVVKVDSGFNINVNGNAQLIVGGEKIDGLKVTITSAMDDSIQGDITGNGNSVISTAGDWQGLLLQSNAYMKAVGMEISYADTAIFGQGAILDLDHLFLFDSAFEGLFLSAGSGAALSGSINNLSINNTGEQGIYLEALGADLLDIVISGNNSVTGVNSAFAAIEVRGAQAKATLDSFVVNGGDVGIALFDGASPYLSDINIQSSLSAGLLFEGNSQPLLFNNVILNNTSIPVLLIGQDLPMNVVPTEGVGVQQWAASIEGTLTTDVIMNAEPLGTGSVWHVRAPVLVPSPYSLTMGAGAIVKFDTSSDLTVLSGSPGGQLNINGTMSNRVILTSLADDDALVGGDTAGDGATTPTAGDWNGIHYQPGSLGTISETDILFAQIGLLVEESLVFNNVLVQFSAMNGIAVQTSSATDTASPTFNGVTVDTVDSGAGIYIDNQAGGTADPVFNPPGQVLNVNEGAACCAAVWLRGSASPTFSNYEIVGGYKGIKINDAASGQFIENIIRDALLQGVYVETTGAPEFYANKILNNGDGSVDGAGLYAFNSSLSNIRHNMFRGNLGAKGGAIAADNSLLLLENNLLIQNHALNEGGAIAALNSASVNCSHCTIAENRVFSALAGGGVNVNSVGETIVLPYSILWNNSDSIGINDYFGLPILTNTIVVDPGFTANWYLNQSGAAIDAAGANGASYLAGLTTDVLGSIDVNPFDSGFHLNSGMAPVDAANSVVNYPVNVAALSTVAIVIEPRDSANNILGTGLDVTINHLSGSDPVEEGTISNSDQVRDLGNGSYEFFYQAPSTGGTSDLYEVLVNGTSLVNQPSIFTTP